MYMKKNNIGKKMNMNRFGYIIKNNVFISDYGNDSKPDT